MCNMIAEKCKFFSFHPLSTRLACAKVFLIEKKRQAVCRSVSLVITVCGIQFENLLLVLARFYAYRCAPKSLDIASFHFDRCARNNDAIIEIKTNRFLQIAHANRNCDHMWVSFVKINLK